MHAENNKFVLNFAKEYFNNPESVQDLANSFSEMRNGIRIYAQNLESANSVAEKLRSAGLSENLSFYQSTSASSGIDIVIIP
jgi:hypothetical protein